MEQEIKPLMTIDEKSLKNNTSDVEIFGKDLWKLICKASSKAQG